MAEQKFLIQTEFETKVNRASLDRSLAEIRDRLKGNEANVTIKFKSADPSAIGTAKIVSKQIRDIRTQAEKTTSKLRNLGAEIGGYFTRFTAFTLAASTVFRFIRFIDDANREVLEYDASLVKVAQTLGTTRKNLSGLTDEIFRLSSSLGVSSKELIDASLVIAQAGFNARDTQKSLDLLAKTALAPSFKDMGNTVQGMIAIMNQFGISIDQMEGKFDVLNEVSKRYTVEAEDIISAVRIAGGVFSAAGGNLEEFISIFTAIKDTTQESAETIAQAIKTISGRLQRPKTVDLLESFGIRGVRDEVTGEFAGVFQALDAISQGVANNNISTRSVAFAEIIEELGGLRQLGKVVPALLQFSKAQQVLGVSTNSVNSLLRDQLLSQDALTRSITKAREEWVKLLVAFSQNEDIRELSAFLLRMGETLARIVNSFQSLLPYLAILGAAKSARAIGILASGAINKPARIRALASGGFINTGSGNKDDVPAMLTQGEYVLNRKAVKSIGVNTLNALNTGNISHFAEGGPVKPLRGAALNAAVQKLYREASLALDKKLTEDLGSLDVGDIEFLPRDLVQLNIPKSLRKSPLVEEAKQLRKEMDALAEAQRKASESLAEAKKKASEASFRAETESLLSSSLNVSNRGRAPSIPHREIYGPPLSGSAIDAVINKVFREERAKYGTPDRSPLNVGDIELLPKDLVQLKIPSKIINEQRSIDLKREGARQTAREQAQLEAAIARALNVSTRPKLPVLPTLRTDVNRLENIGINPDIVSRFRKPEPTIPGTSRAQNLYGAGYEKLLPYFADQYKKLRQSDPNLTAQEAYNRVLNPLPIIGRSPKQDEIDRVLSNPNVSNDFKKSFREGKRSVDTTRLQNLGLPIGITEQLARNKLIPTNVKSGSTQSYKQKLLEKDLVPLTIPKSLVKNPLNQLQNEIATDALFESYDKLAQKRIESSRPSLRRRPTDNQIVDFLGPYKPSGNVIKPDVGSATDSTASKRFKELSSQYYKEIRESDKNIAANQAYVLAKRKATDQISKEVGTFSRSDKIREAFNKNLGNLGTAYGRVKDSISSKFTTKNIGSGAAFGALLLTQSDAGDRIFGKSPTGVGIQSAIGGGLSGGLIAGGFGAGPIGIAAGAIAGGALAISTHLKQLEKSLAEEKVSKALDKIAENISKIKFGTDIPTGDITTLFDNAKAVADRNIRENSPGFLSSVGASASFIGDFFNKLITEGEFFQDQTAFVNRTTDLTDATLKANREANIQAFGPVAEILNKVLQENIRVGKIKNIDDIDKILPNFFKAQSLAQTGDEFSAGLKREEFRKTQFRRVSNVAKFEDLVRSGSTLGLESLLRTNSITDKLFKQNRSINDPSSFLFDYSGLRNVGTGSFAKSLRGLGLSKNRQAQALDLNKAVASLPGILSTTPTDSNYIETFQDKLRNAGVSFDTASQLAGALQSLEPTVEDFHLAMKNAPELVEKLMQSIRGNITPLEDLGKQLNELNTVVLNEFINVLSQRTNAADAKFNANVASYETSRLTRQFNNLVPTAGVDNKLFRTNIAASTGVSTVKDLIGQIVSNTNAGKLTGDARFIATANNATEALKKFADVTNRTRDIQDRLNVLQESRAAKINIGERLLSTTGSEGIKLRTDLASARSFVESGADIRGLSRRKQISVIEGLRSIGSGILPGLDKTGDTVANETIEKLFGIKSSTESKEIESLQKQIINAQKESAEAARFLAEREAVVFNDFLFGLQAENNRFLSLYRVGKGFSSGGFISGFGGGDTVPARLERGEYVLNKYAVKKIGVDKLNEMNNGVVKFQSGGLVEFNTNFGANIQKLTEAIAGIPHTIQIEARHIVEVIHNGAQIFANLEPSVIKLVESVTEQALNKMIRQKFPDVGRFNV